MSDAVVPMRSLEGTILEVKACLKAVRTSLTALEMLAYVMRSERVRGYWQQVATVEANLKAELIELRQAQQARKEGP